MAIFSKILRRLNGSDVQTFTPPATAYDLWCDSYDSQPDNLMLALDEEIFSLLLSKIPLRNRVIADVGCGTGRHWEKMLLPKPSAIYGFDVSEGMLAKLKEKYPDAFVRLIPESNMLQIGDGQADVLISTLTIAHIENIKEAASEWSRVIKEGGQLIITDFHPEALAVGAKRTFTHNGTTVAIKNYIHHIDSIVTLFTGLGFEILDLEERVIDSTMKHYYEQKQALHVYEKFRGRPIIFGMRLRKKHAAS